MADKAKHSTADLEEKIESYKEKILDLSFSFGERMSKSEMPSKDEIAERALYMKMHTDLVKILKETNKGKARSKGQNFNEGITPTSEIPMGIPNVQQNTKNVAI